MIRAGVPRGGHLILARNPADDPTTAQLDQLRQQQADAARGGVNQCDITRLNRMEVRREMAGGQPLHHQRCRRPVADRIWHGRKRGNRQRDALRVAARTIDPGDALARPKLGYAVAHGDDAARTFDA